MEYNKQLEALETIFLRMVVSTEGTPAVPLRPHEVATWVRSLCGTPRHFINGACARQWLVANASGDISLGGPIYVLHKKHWPNKLPSLRPWLLNLAMVLEQQAGGVILKMGALADAATIDKRWQHVVWDVMLAAAPGLAMMLSSDDDGPVIRLASELLDSELIMKIIDTDRSPPHKLSMPMDVTE